MVAWMNGKKLIRTCVGVASVCLAASSASAVEVTVKNDSFQSGGSANVQAGFVAGESAAAWLTSPCDGVIVAVQVAWLSLSGGTGQSVEDSITVFSAGTFPNPGAPMINASNNQPAVLVAPVMTDGALNEFRFVDDQNAIPLSIPVSAGQVFVVSFKFANSPSPSNGPSVITDIGGCQAGKNGIFAIPPGVWFNSCFLGVTGDFVIRAVINCPDSGGCCLNSGQTCQNNMTQAACIGAGGVYLGNNVVCGANSCRGACCIPPSTCLNVIQANCTAAGSTFGGVGTACATHVCFPIGACCMPNGSCQNNMSPAQCAAVKGTFQGHNSNCFNVICPVPDGACCLGDICVDGVAQNDCVCAECVWMGPDSVCATNPCTKPNCPADANNDTLINIDDLVMVITNWGNCAGCTPPGNCSGDTTHNCVVNIDDLVLVITSWGACP